MKLYMQYLVPILGGLVAGYGHRNPWSILYKTFKLLPTNGELTEMIESIFKYVSIDERAMGAMVIGLAQKGETDT
jgi:ubiquinone/menaquinone biosynthesis C-methylase UbiE